MTNQQFHVTDEQLLLHASAEPSEAAGVNVGAHLETCTRCRARLNELETTLAEFGAAYRASEIPPASAPRRQFNDRLRDTSAVQRTSGHLSSRWAILQGHYRLAAVAAIVIAAVFVTLRVETSRRLETMTASRGSWEEPDLKLTPGVTVPVAESLLCGSDAARPAPAVSVSLKRKVFEAYGVTPPRPDDYEVDYLITPELGGATDIRNLWPEPYQDTVWNAHVKDQLEDRLHRMVCRGELDLATAQHDISTDWIAAYRKYFHVDQPAHNETSLTLSRRPHISRPS